MGSFYSKLPSASVHGGRGLEQEGGDAEKRPELKFLTSGDDGETFAVMIKNNTEYGQLMDNSFNYEVYINRKELHWYLLIKLENSKLPLLSFEIITPNNDTIQACVCVQEDDTNKERCTTVMTSMTELCLAADTIRQQMGKYNLRTSNCQHFCNAMLNTLSCPTFQTTIGPQLPAECSNDNRKFDDTTLVRSCVTSRLNCNIHSGTDEEALC